MYQAVWLLFLVAGLLIGGTYAAYQAGNKPLTIAGILVSTISFVAAMAWLVSQMQA